MSNSIKVLLAKVGLDPHDKGIKLVARGLRDIGNMEVTYTGLYRSVEEVTAQALRDDVDVVGISVHTGMQMNIFPQLRNSVDSSGHRDIILIGGGIVPEQDINSLKDSGIISEFFGPSSSIETVIAWIRDALNKKNQAGRL